MMQTLGQHDRDAMQTGLMCTLLDWRLSLMLLGMCCSACTSLQVHTHSQHHDSGLRRGDLYEHGIAFLTPSTVTGQEEDRQALALVFSETLQGLQPKLRTVSLAETLSRINRAGLTEDYRAMYENYRLTGIFDRDILQRLGEVTAARYVVQLKLAGFEQTSQGRFGLLGWRVVDTKQAKLRLFMQIWDTQSGTIVWEASHEMNHALDTTREAPITFKGIVAASAQQLLQKLPSWPAPEDSEALRLGGLGAPLDRSIEHRQHRKLSE